MLLLLHTLVTLILASALRLQSNKFSNMYFCMRRACIPKKATFEVVSSSFHSYVTVDKNKARLFTDGNPIVFSGAVQSVSGKPKLAEEVLVGDSSGNTIARGFYNPYSSYRVRITAIRHENDFDVTLDDVLYNRIKNAYSLRKSVGLPTRGETTVYRLVNAEGDRLGGLTIDVIGQSVVCQSCACWTEIYKDKILAALEKVINNKNMKIIWRRVEGRLAQDGFPELADKTKSASNETASELNTEVANSDETEDSLDSTIEEIVYENRLQYVAFPEKGQKTGFYADQRDNRKFIQSMSKGRDVLDLFCYSGGFSLNALLGGAKSVIGVDSSQVAIDLALRNLDLNMELLQSSVPGFNKSTSRFVKYDAVEYVKTLIDKNKMFDLIICDPPKFAPNRNSLQKAKKKYEHLNAQVMKLVRPGGYLMTCSCSAAITQSPDMFESILIESARVAKRDVTIVAKRGAADFDHPSHIAYKENDYLTAYLLRIL